MLKYYAPFFDLSGYGCASRLYLLALYEAGYRFNAVPIKFDRETNRRFLDKRVIELAESLQDSDSYRDSILLNHVTPHAGCPPGQFEKRILYSVWETDKIPREFIRFIEPYDKVLTASEFSKNAFLNVMPDLNISVVPHVIEQPEGKLHIPDEIRTLIESKELVFFWNGEFHIGKGYDRIISAFSRAFSDDEDVLLIFKTYNLASIHYEQEFYRILSEHKTGKAKNVLPIFGNIDIQFMRGLYDICDVFVNTSHREAWSLTTSEAIAQDKLVVAPDKGGHTEFLNCQNSVLFPSFFDDVDKNLEFSRRIYAGQKWIDFSTDLLVDALKDVRVNYKKKLTKFLPNIELTKEKFNSNNVASKLIREIEC